mmetsp:Transcript_6225/g.8507  ORF Transcript_6225/g.8507 Transcript_6225/m.8507 type:complete len:329 (+) Transcript_6225:33-1019(+)
MVPEKNSLLMEISLLTILCFLCLSSKIAAFVPTHGLRIPSIDHRIAHGVEKLQMSWGFLETFRPKQKETPADLKKKPILICPAQFCVAEDYAEMIEELEQRGHSAYVADIGRSDWLKIVPATFTADYWTGALKPQNCLQFFFEGIEKTMDQIKEENPGQQVHIIGHSIGGWIVRAYLGEVCTSAERENFCSLTTLGSPHKTPPQGSIWETVDQTRGLLKYVNSNFPGAFHENIQYTCVAGASTEGGLGIDLEQLVAYSSYLPLCGDGSANGDGIVPVDTATLEGAESIIIPGAKHAGFLPTPGRSIKISKYEWYGSASLIPAWANRLD